MVFQLHRGDLVALVGCSDGRPPQEEPLLRGTVAALEGLGLRPVESPVLYRRRGTASGLPEERAEALMAAFRDPAIRAVLDVSGGDQANQLLPLLDFGELAQNWKPFFGYSDLTCLLNALYAKTGLPAVLYQVKNLADACGESQRAAFAASLLEGKGDLWTYPVAFLQGRRMAGPLVGGNLRCLLKLAGTPYWPDLTGRVLLLEAYTGSAGRIAAGLCQLAQMGAFAQAAGVLLGTFTQLDREEGPQAVEQLALAAIGPGVPVARTHQVGHGADSRGALLGEPVCLTAKD